MAELQKHLYSDFDIELLSIVDEQMHRMADDSTVLDGKDVRFLWINKELIHQICIKM